jgi:hypothetical protein
MAWEQITYQEELGPRFAYRDPTTGKESPYNFGAGKDILDQKGITEESIREAMMASNSGPVEFSQWAQSTGLNLGGAMAGHMKVLEQSLGDRGTGFEGAVRQYAPMLPYIGMGAAAALGGTAGAASAGAVSSEIGAASFSTPAATTATEFGFGGASFGTGASVPAMTTVGSGITATAVPTSTLTGLGVAGSAGAVGAAELSRGAAEGASGGASSGGASGGGAVAAKSGVTSADLLLVSSGISSLAGLTGGGPEAPAAVGAASMDIGAERTSSSIASRETDFETRRQKAGRAAAANSVARNDNAMDLLGVVGSTTPRRRAGGQRKILGY